MQTKKLCWLILLFFICTKEAMSYERAPQIIFLNGPSSSGKTSLAKALQEALDEHFLYISLDQMIEMMPAKLNQWIDVPDLIGFGSKRSQDPSGYPLSEIKIGPFAEEMRHTFRRLSAAIVQRGHFLVIDDVFFRKQDAEYWQKELMDFDVLWVKLHAPLEVLEEREKQRGNRDGCSRNQFYNAYQKESYDLEIDTSLHSLEQSVALVRSRFS